MLTLIGETKKLDNGRGQIKGELKNEKECSGRWFEVEVYKGGRYPITPLGQERPKAWRAEIV